MNTRDLTPEIKELMDHYESRIEQSTDQQKGWIQIGVPYLRKIIELHDIRDEYVVKLANLKEKIGCDDCCGDDE